MATYLVADLPTVKGFSDFFWHSILIFLSDALFSRSSKHINVFRVDYLPWFIFSRLKFTKIVKKSGGLKKSVLPWKPNLITSESVSPLEIGVYQVSLVSVVN